MVVRSLVAGSVAAALLNLPDRMRHGGSLPRRDRGRGVDLACCGVARDRSPGAFS